MELEQRFMIEYIYRKKSSIKIFTHLAIIVNGSARKSWAYWLIYYIEYF